MDKSGQPQPRLGATFYPGGADDFYIPEVVSPAPQRILTEVPENMQENLAYLELHAQRSAGSNAQTPSGIVALYETQGDANRQYHASPNAQSSTHANSIPIIQERGHQGYEANIYTDSLEQPNFSPFPVLRNPPPNIPPTDEEKEAILEAARVAVLGSNDPELQLTWAHDALVYVEVAMRNEERISVIQSSRPQTPRVEHMLREDAMKIVEFLADQHHPKAEYLKGMWLEFGRFGHRIDKREAFHCYTRAADKGYARAEYRIGMQFETSNEPSKAIKYYQKGADAGDSASCYRLGMMALLGQHGQQQDYERGLNLIFLAAQTADDNAPQGAYVFGMLQARQLAQVEVPERFLPLDTIGARINIEKAAFLGFAKAQVKMGSAYELCELGCDFNPALSLHYSSLAARQGEPEAEMAISKWFLCGQEGVFEKNEGMAYTYAKRAAQDGLSTAQFAMGYFNEVGIHVPVNLREAKEWYRKAAANGNNDAAGRIDSLSRSKTLSRQDHERVAIHRIKSQYGSHVQSNPPRRPSLPTTVEMPDPSRLSLHPNPSAASYQRQPASAVPHSRQTVGSLPRPVQPNALGERADFRPSSAFGINPNLRPTSVATVGGTPNPHDPTGFPNPPRPYSSGSGRPDVDQASYGPHGRLPHVNRPPVPGSTPPASLGQSQRQTKPVISLGKLDIGFVAPLDPNGADRKQRPQEHANTSHDRSRPIPPKGTADTQAERVSSKTSAKTSRTSTPVAAHSSRPSDRPQSASTNKPLPPTIPNKPTTTPSKPATPTPVARPPGQGPQTFEEMGVPQAKVERECVIM